MILRRRQRRQRHPHHGLVLVGVELAIVWSVKWIGIKVGTPGEQKTEILGQLIAHYKILRKIASGGMGDVYLAHDITLDRHVAFKVLPPELADNAERRSRFTRE